MNGDADADVTKKFQDFSVEDKAGCSKITPNNNKTTDIRKSENADEPKCSIVSPNSNNISTETRELSVADESTTPLNTATTAESYQSVSVKSLVYMLLFGYLYFCSKNNDISSVQKHYCTLGLGFELGLGLDC